MIKIVFVNGEKIIYKNNEYEKSDVFENRLFVKTDNKYVYFPLYNILSYEIEEKPKEQKPMRKKEINGIGILVPDCYTDKNDRYRERPWGAGIVAGAGTAQCVKSNRCELSHSCTKEKGYLF